MSKQDLIRHVPPVPSPVTPQM